MPLVADASELEENVKLRRPRTQFGQSISMTDPNGQKIQSSTQPSRYKSPISSLLLSTFSNSTTNEAVQTSINTKKKKNFTAASFRGLGCTAGASEQVSVPAVIRSSADWQGKKKMKKKKHKKGGSNKAHDSNKSKQGGVDFSNSNSSNCVDFQDVWCGPGIGFSTDAAPSVDCVVARRNAPARVKIDAEKINTRERHSSCIGRRTVNPETISFINPDSEFLTTRAGLETFEASRYHRHVRQLSSEGLTEIMMIQGGTIMGGNLTTPDHFRDWRLDIDNMTYEQLLELGEKIGRVNTGLKEDEMIRYIRKIKPSVLNDLSKHQLDKKCSICQEEYEKGDELGKLNCGHSYHLECVKQWLAQKNVCAICKTEVMIRQ